MTARAAVAAEEKMLDARRLTQEISPAAPAETVEQPKEDGFQAKELKELVAAHEAAAVEEADDFDVDDLLKQVSELTEEEGAYDEDEPGEGSAIDRFLSDRSGAASEEELQALLDDAMSAAEQAPVPDIPVSDMMKVDPEEEKFFEDTQEQDEEDDEDEEDELSEEEMMEKLLREATAELAHDVSWVSSAAEKKAEKKAEKPEKQLSIPEAQTEAEDEPEEEPMRISVKRKGKPKVSRKPSDDDEIEGQMSIPEEFMPDNDTKNTAEKKNTVDLQFGHESGNSSNHNERILEMHRMGRSNMAIAKDLGLGIGEVKLVIDLFENMA